MAVSSLNYQLLHNDSLSAELAAITGHPGILGSLLQIGPPLNPTFPGDNQTLQYSAGLRSSDLTDTGISSVGSIQSSLPPDFDADAGATGTGISKAVRLSVSGISAALNAGGSLRFSVPVAMVDGYPASTEYFASKTGGWGEWLASGSGYMRSRIPESGDPNRLYTEAGVRVGPDSNEYLEIAYYWDGSFSWFELDKLPLRVARSAPGPDSDFNSFYLVGLTGTGGTGNTITMRDARLYTGPLNYVANANYGKIVFFGDSFITQGSLSSTQASSGGTALWNPGFGFTSGGAPATGGAYTSDCNIVMAFMRECFRGGLQPSSSNHNAAQSGDKLTSCKDRATTWFGSNTAQVAVISIGTNNVGEASEFDATDKANNEADYKTLIDECLAGGCERIVINKVASLKADAAYDNANHDANIDWWNNTLIPIIAAYSNRVVVADCFTAMGGLATDLTLFQSSNIHPSAKGQHMYGRTLGEALMGSF